MEKLRFRQVHLDFHTSPYISDVGAKFDKARWQETLRSARVDSINLFSCCHHGWSYHPTKVGKMHPHLSFNLLRAQIEASKEIGIDTPVYITAGLNDMVAELHPEWRELTSEGRYAGWQASPILAGFHKFCFNTPYLDYLCELISETAELFPEANGIWLDIISQGQCCCNWCMAGMKKSGLNPSIEADRKAYARQTLLKYYRRATEAARHRDPKMRVFHNSGHISMGDTDILKYFSHLELESLPTGGWGYDHYPMSAAYARKLPLDFLGMTGKFHTAWGEFGGIKHPNALRYECASMIANGSKCSIGDQLHPCGELDSSSYEAIGAAYSEVEAKEPWCGDVVSAAKIAVLSSAAVNNRWDRDSDASDDVGASRILLEAHQPFDFIDLSMDFSPYRVLLLPDNIKLGADLEKRLREHLDKGGKLILSNQSGLRADGSGPAFGLDFKHEGVSEFCPDYIKADPKFAPSFARTPFVMYAPSQRIKVRSGQSLGQVFDPYFNRTFEHFCSHQHAPCRMEPSGCDAGVLSGNILYFAHPVFSIYRGYGAVAVKEYVVNAIKALLGDDFLETSLPSQGRLTLMRQPQSHRYVLHLLYANTILRGDKMNLTGGTASSNFTLEVVEELNPIYNVSVCVAIPEAVKRVTLEPQGKDIPFTAENGRIRFAVESFVCHQMAVLHY